MKFPRNAKIFRGHLDVAPFAGVFFCLAIFLLLLSLVYTPGVAVQLPVARTELTGAAGRTAVVAMDPGGQYYFANQIISESNLLARLREEVRQGDEPLTLVLQVDKRAAHEKLTRLIELGKAAGISNFFDEMLPPFDAPAAARNPGR